MYDPASRGEGVGDTQPDTGTLAVVLLSPYPQENLQSCKSHGETRDLHVRRRKSGGISGSKQGQDIDNFETIWPIRGLGLSVGKTMENKKAMVLRMHHFVSTANGQARGEQPESQKRNAKRQVVKDHGK